MADYTATCYGVGNSRKDGKSNTSSALRNEKSTMSKGQECMRFVVASEDEIMGGEIWVNKDTTVAASDTLTITVTAG